MSAGDRLAFDEFYDLYFKSIFAFCLGKIREKEEAENAAADTFVRIYQYPDVGQIENPENWIFTVAKNICLNYLNKKNRRAKILDEISWKFDKLERQAAGQNLDVQFFDDRFKEALKPSDYQIWKLHEQGHDNKSISSQLGKNEKTVANRKVEIIKAVKQIVEIHLDKNGKE